MARVPLRERGREEWIRLRFPCHSSFLLVSPSGRWRVGPSMETTQKEPIRPIPRFKKPQLSPSPSCCQAEPRGRPSLRWRTSPPPHSASATELRGTRAARAAPLATTLGSATQNAAELTFSLVRGAVGPAEVCPPLQGHGDFRVRPGTPPGSTGSRDSSVSLPRDPVDVLGWGCESWPAC